MCMQNIKKRNSVLFTNYCKLCPRTLPYIKINVFSLAYTYSDSTKSVKRQIMSTLIGITQAQLEEVLTKGDVDTVQFCQQHGLMPIAMTCVTCQQEMAVVYNRGRAKKGIAWRCGMAACRYEVSIRKHTVFESSKLSIQNIIRLLYFWATRRSTADAVHELGLSCSTVAQWYKFRRDLCITFM